MHSNATTTRCRATAAGLALIVSACGGVRAASPAAHRRTAPVRSGSSAALARGDVRDERGAAPADRAVTLEHTGDHDYRRWRLINRTADAIDGIGGAFDPRLERLDLDGQWVPMETPGRTCAACAPSHLGPGGAADVEVRGSTSPYAAGTYRLTVDYSASGHSAEVRAATITFDLVGLDGAEAEHALDAFRDRGGEPVARAAMVYLIMAGPPRLVPRLLEIRGPSFDTWNRVFDVLGRVARSPAALRIGVQGGDEQRSLAAAIALSRYVGSDADALSEEPLRRALDRPSGLERDVVNALGERMMRLHDSSIAVRLVERLGTAPEEEIEATAFALVEAASSSSEHDGPLDRSLRLRAARALRRAARSSSAQLRDVLVRAATALSRDDALRTFIPDGLHDEPASGFMIDDPRLEPLFSARARELRIIVRRSP